MKSIIYLLIVLARFSIGITNGQTIKVPDGDSIQPTPFFKSSLLPVGLIGLGAIVNNSNFEKQWQTKLRNKVGNNFEFPIDNYLQYAPIAELYAADLAGVKAKKHWFDQTKYLLLSNLFSFALTHSLKTITNKKRPNGSPNSFPSGHTSLAFTNARILYREFKNTSPALAYSGYAFAVTTGSFRMINNKHWLSDVLAGAGIGIISTELVYYFEPFKNFNPFKKTKNITLIPQINGDKFGFYFACHFPNTRN
jgi:membrane-associated phospholipid phosphatase